MKNKIFIGAALLATASMFTACSDDNDSNPTLIQPTEFVLNTPAYANIDVDLAKTQTLELSWSQPKYTAENAPINATYEIQVSTTDSYNVSTDEAAADEENKKVADYVILNETATTCNIELPSSSLAKAIMELTKWDEANVPEVCPVYLRVNAYVAEGDKKLNPIASNSVKINVNPYYIELKDATPLMWYFVGNMFGGKWGSDIGVDALPMFLDPAFVYDKKTGTGEITYLNYFITGPYKENGESDEAGFKIQRADFNWDYGMTGDGSQYDKINYRNGGGDGGHIVAGADGYYLITLNTANNTATMVKQDIAPENYGNICIAGSFNGWGDTPMNAYNKDGVENHAWYYVLDVTDAQATFKIKTAGDWETGVNWGYDSNGGTVLNAVGQKGGGDITLTTGKYCISFNDINGVFSIVKL